MAVLTCVLVAVAACAAVSANNIYITEASKDDCGCKATIEDRSYAAPEKDECKVKNLQHVCNCHFHITGNKGEQTCTKNIHCPENLSCIDGDCNDPCRGLCGNNAICNVSRHVPSCSCKKGFTGDPALGCHEPEKKFHLYYDRQLKFSDALAECNKMGLELATLDSQAEFEKVHSLIRAHEKEFKHSNPAFWTSGLEVSNEVYIWSSTGREVTFKNWGPGDPNHYQHDNGPERCVVLWPAFNYGMGDYNCLIQLYYVCQEYV